MGKTCFKEIGPTPCVKTSAYELEVALCMCRSNPCKKIARGDLGPLKMSEIQDRAIGTRAYTGHDENRVGLPLGAPAVFPNKRISVI